MLAETKQKAPRASAGLLTKTSMQAAFYARFSYFFGEPSFKLTSSVLFSILVNVKLPLFFSDLAGPSLDISYIYLRVVAFFF